MNIKKLTAKKKGISPVIASIILIAVTIAIGVAIAGFVFGIFGTYSAAPNVSVQSTQLIASNQTLTINLHNTGTANVNVANVRGGVLFVKAVGTWPALQGNSLGVIKATLEQPAGTPAVITPGTTYTFTIDLGGGSTLTSVVTAIP